MLSIHRWTVVAACAGLGVCIGLAGCRREEAAAPEKTPVPKIPDTAPKGLPLVKPKPVQPPTWVRQPGPVATTPTPESQPGEVGQPTPPPTPKPAEPSPPVAEQEQDASDAPPFFPRGLREVPGWVKAGPIKTSLPGKFDELLDNDTIAIIKPYQTKRVATCTYRGTERADEQTASVLVIQADHPEDAFGIFTVLGTGSFSQVSGTMTRSEVSQGTLTIHVWKERQYIRLVGRSGDKPAPKEACDALIRRMTFLMPDAPLPGLVGAMPEGGAVPDKRWLVRGLSSLSGPGAAELKLPEPSRLARLLRLDKDSQMLIATYRVPRAARPHLVWVVRYDSPQQARDAYNNYHAFLAGATDPWSSSTLLIRPKGRYLLGTWTAEEESLGPVLPKLLSNLE